MTRMTVEEWHGLTTPDGRLNVSADEFWRIVYGKAMPKPRPKEFKRVCLKCRRVEMRGKQQYCEKCYAKHRNQVRRASETAELANSPIEAEALTQAESYSGYSGPGTHQNDSTGVLAPKGGAK